MATSFQSRLGNAPEEGTKAPCSVATTSNITLSGLQTIGAYTVVADDRVLVRAQAATTEHGIYDVSSGAWTRSKDFNNANDVVSGIIIPISETNDLYKATFTGSYNPGTTVVTFPLEKDAVTFDPYDSVVSMIGSSTAAGNTVHTEAYRTGWKATAGNPKGSAKYVCITRAQYDIVRGNANGPDHATNGTGYIDHEDTATGNVYLLEVPHPNLYQCGGYGDDSNTDNVYLSAMETYFNEIYITAGTFKIDVTSATVTITKDLIFDNSAIIVLYRSSGTNRLDLRGDLDAPASQILDLSNIVTTRAAWDTIFFAGTGQAELPLTFGFGTTTFNQAFRVPVKPLLPQHFGAAGLPGTDDTLPVQICIDMHKPMELVTDHDVTQIVLRGNEQVFNFNNFKIRGVPVATDYSSIIEIKCGFSRLTDIRVDGQKSQFYQCGVHWYTNDTNVYFPAWNVINGLYLENCYLGLCIGGLPGQTTFSAQGASETAPTATDAPVSESYVTGMRTITCLSGLLGNQPNGKIRFSGCTIITPNITGFSAPAGGRATLALADYSTMTLQYPGTGIGFSSSNLVNTDTSKTIPLLTLAGGDVSFVACDIESETQIRIKPYTGTFASNGSTHAGQTFYAESILNIDSPSNFGWNFGLDDPVIVVDDKANGQIVLAKCRPTFQSGATGSRTAPFMMCTDTFSGLDAGASKAQIIAASTIYINPYIKVALDQCLFRDQAWASVSSSFTGLIQGLPNIHITSLTVTGTAAIDTSAPADDPLITSVTSQITQSDRSDGPWVGAVDPTGINLAAAITSGTDGGWTVTTTGGVGAQVDSQLGISDGPVVIGDDITDTSPTRYDNAIQLTSGTNSGGGTCKMESPFVACGCQVGYMINLFIHTPEASPGAFLFAIRLDSYDFDGNLLEEVSAISSTEDKLTDDWTHFITMAKTHKNATKLKLVIYVEEGATLQVTGIR